MKLFCTLNIRKSDVYNQTSRSGMHSLEVVDSRHFGRLGNENTLVFAKMALSCTFCYE